MEEGFCVDIIFITRSWRVDSREYCTVYISGGTGGEGGGGRPGKLATLAFC